MAVPATKQRVGLLEPAIRKDGTPPTKECNSQDNTQFSFSHWLCKSVLASFWYVKINEKFYNSTKQQSLIRS